MLNRRSFLGALAGIGAVFGIRPSLSAAPKAEWSVAGVSLGNADAGQSVRVLAMNYAERDYARIALMGDTLQNVCYTVIAQERITTGDLVEWDGTRGRLVRADLATYRKGIGLSGSRETDSRTWKVMRDVEPR